MSKEVVLIVWVEERLDSIWTVDCSIGNVFCGIRKRLWTTLFFTSKSILIFVVSRNGTWTKVKTMTKQVVLIVWVEERLDSNWTVDCSIENVFCGIHKKLWRTLFFTSKSMLIFVVSRNGNKTKVQMMSNEVALIVWVEERLDSIWTVDCTIGNVFCGIGKKLWTTLFFTSKSILIFAVSRNGTKTKV